MQEPLLDPPLAQGAEDWAGLHEVRPGADDVDDWSGHGQRVRGSHLMANDPSRDVRPD